MTWFLPDPVRDEVASRGVFGASGAFGVVTLVVLFVVLLEHEVLRAAAPAKPRLTLLFTAAMALSAPVVLIVVARIADLLR